MVTFPDFQPETATDAEVSRRAGPRHRKATNVTTHPKLVAGESAAGSAAGRESLRCLGRYAIEFFTTMTTAYIRP
jgi:hypothetical protein